MIRPALALLPAMAAALLVSACGSDAPSTDAAVAGAAPATGGPATTAAGSPVVVTEPSVAAARERIIPVNGDLAEIVYALGLGDRVVATDISATYPPDADATPKIGYQRALVAETILAHEPTVVLADELAGPREVLDQLRAAGVRVVELDRDETLDAPARKIREVAAALGVASRGEELVATLEEELAAARTAADEAVARDGRPKVLAMYLRGENVQLVFGEDSGIDAVIEAAGGTDLGTAMGVVDNAELSIEAVVEAQPDVLLVTTTGLESVGGVDALVAMPGIDRTPAARDRRVVVFEDQYLYGLGPRTGRLVAELTAAIHQTESPATSSQSTTSP